MRQMLHYGVGYAGANWIWQLRELVNALVVGRYGGAAAVGYVAFTVRLVDALSFTKAAAWRLSLAVLARVQHDRRRLTEALNEGMRLQVLVSGPVLVTFGFVAPWAITGLFGERWLPVLTVFPFIALGYLTNAVFSLHSSALYVVKQTWQVGLFHAVHVALFAGAALVLVPRLGMVGYGWSETVALLSYALLHSRVARHIGVPTYGLVKLWWFAWALLLFWRQLGWWSLVGPLVALAWPGAARQLRSYVVNVAGLIHAR
jgi:PST family polysaccharide transporter